MDNTFCTQPYNQVHVGSTGHFAPCCVFSEVERKKLFDKYESIDDYINSSELSQLKNDLSNGIRHSGCHQCWYHEDRGSPSMRTMRAYEPTDRIRHIYLTFGNQCNVACRICSPQRSSLLNKINKEIIKQDPNVDRMMFHTIDKTNFRYNNPTWYKDLLNNFIDEFKNIDLFETSGGEPFINFHFKKFLDKLENTGYKYKKIRIITNGSFTKEQIAQVCRIFEYVEINLSTDAFSKKLYELLRWPLKKEDMDEKVKILKNETGINRVNVIYVPHNLNLQEIVESFLYVKSIHKKFHVSLSWLNGARWFDPLLTPKWIQENFLESVEKNLLTIKNFERKEKKALLKLYELVMNNQGKSLTKEQIQMVKKFEIYIDKSDKPRNTNTWEIIGWKASDICGT